MLKNTHKKYRKVSSRFYIKKKLARNHFCFNISLGSLESPLLKPKRQRQCTPAAILILSIIQNGGSFNISVMEDSQLRLPRETNDDTERETKKTSIVATIVRTVSLT